MVISSARLSFDVLENAPDLVSLRACLSSCALLLSLMRARSNARLAKAAASGDRRSFFCFSDSRCTTHGCSKISRTAHCTNMARQTRSKAAGKAPFIVEPLVRDFEFRVLRQNRRVVVDEARRDEIQVARASAASPLTIALLFSCTES